ncbi:S-layer homology domain-containing protein [Texcoconibacillus texcoconensis]|uniref:Putative cupredoxin-like copper-binding protein n=1 Tax=Texcoconibacillus texcoconensis TaxID=1095777 RepID=A0A840QPL3_9BACI|nr:S-layer homology domain-containing protein [Texcoconibacillus texcoconensis]MBB5173352.1 putative cupredoxin-like copper-binding protein [Texcoconibacillus texcoconensis]
MSFIKRHEVKKENNQYIIYLYVDQSQTEFADELGNNKDISSEDLDKTAEGYIKKKFPNIKKATVRVLLGSMLVTSFAYGPVVNNVQAAEAETEVEQQTKVFTDVEDGQFYTEPIEELSERGILTGYDDGTFRPGNDISRADTALILARSIDLDIENAPAPGFTDLTDEGKYYYNAIGALEDAGIVNGYEDGTFKPDQTITRAELAKLIVEAYDLDVDEDADLDFTDIEEGAWYKQYVAPLVENNITFGKTEALFAPADDTTRGEAATFIYRALGLADEGVTPIDEDVTFDFIGINGFIENNENSFSIETKAENVPQDINVRYQATLTGPEGEPVEGQEISYAGGTFTTNEDGVAFFGPSDGFKTEDIGLDEGITTDFITTFTQAGKYELSLSLVDVATGDVVGDTTKEEFTVADPTAATDITFDFHDFTDIVAGEEHNFAIEAKTGFVPDDLSVRYEATLEGPDGEPVEGKEINYETDEGWETFTTGTDGVALFGPSDGFNPADIGLDDGQTTNFNTTFTTAGDYKLTLSLVDADTGETVGNSADHEFTVSEATAPTETVTFDFNDLDDVVAGEEHTFSLEAKAENVPQDINVRYQANLVGPDGDPVSGQEIIYGEGTFTTNEDGVAFFGPIDGFKTEDIGLDEGLTTEFTTTFTEAGEYTLTLSLVDVDTEDTVGDQIEETFTVATG